MELSAAQRKLTFAAVVLVLAGLGVYLLASGGRPASHPAAAGARRPSRQHSAPAASPAATATTPAASPAASSSSPSSPPAAGQVPDIYQWLPFTQSGLASAAAVTTRFGDAYGTFSYTESAARYVATMRSLVTDQLSQEIAAAYSTPGVADLRASRKQVSSGSAVITSLQSFGPSSITFDVTVTEQVTASRDGGTTTASYAVTVTGGDTSWQVSNVELASAGQS